MEIRALTLLQPWASLVALGAKSIETRPSRTWYRGYLLIHAAKTFPGWARNLCKQEPFATVLSRAGYADSPSGRVAPGLLPLGAIVAICNLKHCVRIGTLGVDLPPTEPERSFGDYTVGHYAWILRDVQKLPEPIPTQGCTGLWEPDAAVLALLPELLPALFGETILTLDASG